MLPVELDDLPGAMDSSRIGAAAAASQASPLFHPLLHSHMISRMLRFGSTSVVAHHRLSCISQRWHAFAHDVALITEYRPLFCRQLLPPVNPALVLATSDASASSENAANVSLMASKAFGSASRDGCSTRITAVICRLIRIQADSHSMAEDYCCDESSECDERHPLLPLTTRLVLMLRDEARSKVRADKSSGSDWLNRRSHSVYTNALKRFVAPGLIKEMKEKPQMDVDFVFGPPEPTPSGGDVDGMPAPLLRPDGAGDGDDDDLLGLRQRSQPDGEQQEREQQESEDDFFVKFIYREHFRHLSPADRVAFRARIAHLRDPFTQLAQVSRAAGTCSDDNRNSARSRCHEHVCKTALLLVSIALLVCTIAVCSVGLVLKSDEETLAALENATAAAARARSACCAVNNTDVNGTALLLSNFNATELAASHTRWSDWGCGWANGLATGIEVKRLLGNTSSELVCPAGTEALAAENCTAQQRRADARFAVPPESSVIIAMLCICSIAALNTIISTSPVFASLFWLQCVHEGAGAVFGVIGGVITLIMGIVALLFGLGTQTGFRSKFSSGSAAFARAFCGYDRSNASTVAVLFTEIPSVAIDGPTDPDAFIRTPLRALGIFAGVFGLVSMVALFILMLAKLNKSHYNY